jgi:hypothetical protein
MLKLIKYRIKKYFLLNPHMETVMWFLVFTVVGIIAQIIKVAIDG